MNELTMPPNDKKAERAVLGAMMRSNGDFMEVFGLLRADDFYHFAHQKIWEVLSHLHGAGKPVDAVTVFDEIFKRGFATDVTAEYLVDVWDSAPSLNVMPHAMIVKDYRLRRSLSAYAQKIDLEIEIGCPAGDLVENAEKGLFKAVNDHAGKRDVTALRKAGNDALKELDVRGLRKEEIELPFGWCDVDKLTHGLQRGELVVVGARPSVGKTMFAQNVTENLAAIGKKVFMVTMEQTASSMAERMICHLTKISSWCFRSGKLSPQDKEKICRASETMDAFDVTFDESPRQTASRIASQSRRVAMHGALDLIVVDYLSLMEPEDRKDHRYFQIGLMCQKLKQLAKDVNAPLMLLSQLTRDADGRRPELKDLRESGDIEQHADCVMLLHRPNEVDINKNFQELEVLIRKQRNGPIGDVKLRHNKQYYDLCNWNPDTNF